MQRLIRTYEHNQNLINKFVLSTLKKQRDKANLSEGMEDLFTLFPCLEAAYATDAAFIQVTPVHLRDGRDQSGKGEQIAELVEQDDFENGSLITAPYISQLSGKLVITAVLKTDDGYTFYDFNLRALLERLTLFVEHRRFGFFTRSVYLILGSVLIFFAIFSVLYGFGYFWWDFFVNGQRFSLETIFKPVIAATLGLAFFDLGKTIINHEVFRASETLEAFDAKSFVTFLTSIMIALMIEALLSVFKASLSHFSDLLYASALITSLALLFYVVDHFIRGVGIWKTQSPSKPFGSRKSEH